jgi:Co/Zn/Cd efflux system component
MTISLKESLSFGWHKTKSHSGLLFKILLILFGLQVVYAVVGRVLEGTLIGALAVVALSVAQFVVGVGLTLVTLRIAQGKHVELKEIVPPLEVLWRYFLASVLVGLIVMGVIVGLVLAAMVLAVVTGGMNSVFFPLWIAVGICAGVIAISYFAVRFSMVRYAVLDGSGVVESLTCSTKITKGHMWEVLWFLLVVALLNIAGAILLLVGLLVTIPVTMIAYAHVYEKLHKHPHTHTR